MPRHFASYKISYILLRANLRNIIYQSAAQVLPRLILFLFTFYLARVLGSDEYGKYDFALSVGYLFGVFYELGGNLILTKYTARGQYSFFSFSLKFRLICIAATTAIAFSIFLISGIYNDVIYQILFGALGIAFSSLMNLYFAFFRGVKKMGYEAAVLLIQKILFIGICIIFIMTRIDSMLTLISFTLSMFISWLVIQFIFFKQRKKYAESEENEKINVRNYIKDIFTLALAEMFAIMYFRVTQIILESFAGFNDVGVYGISFKIVEALGNFPAILMIALFPSFAQLAKQNLSEFRKQFNKIFVLLIFLGLAASFFCWIFGRSIFSLIGKDFDKSYIVLRYMTVALTFIFPNYLLTHAMVALELNLKYATVLFSVLVLNILLSILLVPSLGAQGSALSVGFCESGIFLLTLFIIKKETKTIAAKQT